ncbi:putative reverse transcriptase domain-containing protein [Tanacetum coccineum]
MGIILVSPEERMHSYVIRLKFNTSDHAIDCEALLAGLAVSVSKGMKDLHVFIDSPRLVAQTEGNHTPATEQEKKYKKETMDATALFHRIPQSGSTCSTVRAKVYAAGLQLLEDLILSMG